MNYVMIGFFGGEYERNKEVIERRSWGWMPKSIREEGEGDKAER
jgi:hypothetical protein